MSFDWLWHQIATDLFSFDMKIAYEVSLFSGDNDSRNFQIFSSLF
jgi:hypothetical protein